MCKSVNILITVLLLLFSACAIQKGSTSSRLAPVARSFDVCLEQGFLFLNRREYGKAIEQLREAVALNANSAKAYNYLGIAYFQLKNYDSAGEQFEKAIALDSSFASAYNNLGGVYYIQGKLEKAKDNFKKALSLDPNLVAADYSLGTLLFYMGETEEGTSYLSKGIALDPDYLDKNEEFVATLSSSIFRTPEIYFTYARLYASTGNIEKTVDYLKKAKQSGFTDWKRIIEEKEFEKVRDDPRIQEFIRLFSVVIQT